MPVDTFYIIFMPELNYDTVILLIAMINSNVVIINCIPTLIHN